MRRYLSWHRGILDKFCAFCFDHRKIDLGRLLLETQFMLYSYFPSDLQREFHSLPRSGIILPLSRNYSFRLGTIGQSATPDGGCTGHRRWHGQKIY